MENSNISWTHHTANPWWGCEKASPGCARCYAETLSKRWGKEIWGPKKTTEREIKKGVWDDILKWDKEAEEARERRRVFTLSMGDFLEDHPILIEPRKKFMKIVEGLKWLDVLILTKRPQNYRLLSDWFPLFPSHIWMGTSVENQKYADERISILTRIPCKIHFLSVEPILEKIDLDLRGKHYGIDYPNYSEDVSWVICGGESGSGFRPMQVEWAQDIHDQCKSAGIPFFMKQDSALRPGTQGRIPDELWNCKEFPIQG